MKDKIALLCLCISMVLILSAWYFTFPQGYEGHWYSTAAIFAGGGLFADLKRFRLLALGLIAYNVMAAMEAYQTNQSVAQNKGIVHSSSDAAIL